MCIDRGAPRQQRFANLDLSAIVMGFRPQKLL
jgi:hypothetical protein